MTTRTLDPARLDNPHEKPKMLEWMTETEWIARYPDEWVLVIDPDFDEQKGLQSGFVAFHSPEMKDVYDEATRLKPKFCGWPFTGNGPENMEYLL